MKTDSRSHFFSITNIIIILLITILIFQGLSISYNNYSNQIKEQIDISTNHTATDIKKLIKAIDRSDDIDDNRTKQLLETTVKNQFANYLTLANYTNQTNTLVKFLTDNFGSDSGYLERENFQYARANQTFEMIKQILNRTR